MAIAKKTKKKEIVSVISPKIFGEKEMAEVITGDINNLVGKKITLNTVEILPESNKYYTKLFFKINRVDEKKAYTDFDGLELMRDYISRMVVRRVKRIDAVQNITTKDGINIRVKSLATTSRKVSSNVAKSVRNKIAEMVVNVVNGSSLEEFLNGIFSDKIKKDFIKELRKIYPLRNIEFRKIEVAK